MVISIEALDFAYQAGSTKHTVLHDINLDFAAGQLTAIVGQTGSGKSTLVQQLNALLLPTAGQVRVRDWVITAKSKEKHLTPIRKTVGMVFQFPESQLFAPTVLEDVAYGPKNFGQSSADATAAAKKALQAVHLPEDYWAQSPFNLSGGQMRRVALAGVLAADPAILVFDEPTAGLDPEGQADFLNLLKELKAAGKTIILISHQMDQVLAVADQVVVMKDGTVAAHESTAALFARDSAWFAEHALALPSVVAFTKKLVQAGYHFDQQPKTAAELAAALTAQVDWQLAKALLAEQGAGGGVQ
ncbi:energy-coupling factor transporter ATPase [Leuconostocaceae bacterium ESL0958]|nr:energy-coupling factor transporter ATPase [Leuconostocaceae bacterium ESL0958]